MPTPTNELLVAAQEQVFAKLGKCLWNLQLFEQALKSFLPETDITAGPKGRFLEADYQRSVLGILIEQMKRTLTTAERESAETSNNDAKARPYAGKPQIRIRTKIGLSEEAYSEGIDELNELLVRRNELVHHLTEKFDLSSIKNCKSAVVYLDAVNSKTSNIMKMLKTWDEIRMHGAQKISTPEFARYLVYRYHPDFDTDWERTPVVHHLKEAEAMHAEDGWTNLARAVEHFKFKAKDITPKTYGCGSWRQLIKKSGLFEHRSIKATDSEHGQFWYQSKLGPEGVRIFV